MEEVKNEAVVDDDLYAKIETEKLVKEKKRKKNYNNSFPLGYLCACCGDNLSSVHSA